MENVRLHERLQSFMCEFDLHSPYKFTLLHSVLQLKLNVTVIFPDEKYASEKSQIVRKPLMQVLQQLSSLDASVIIMIIVISN